jgi:Leucine-rich repeat (LRR) protein
MKVCSFTEATAINSNTTRVKSEYNATAITFYSNKNISYLPIETGKVFPSLLLVQATYCNLKQISPENFAGMVNVIRLWLSGNKIEDIPPKTFKGLVSLVDLDLRESKSFLVLDRVFRLQFLIQVGTT